MYIPEYISKVLNILNSAGYEAYLVGGCVRDALMGKIPHDFDLTTNALPDEMLMIFDGMRIIETGIKHGTITVVSDGENVEITTYRIDGTYIDNRHPADVSFTRNLSEDLSRRDFTVNAIAYSPYTGYVDIYNGRSDIISGIIRCVGKPDQRFNEDGLRIMRALRFASTLDFEIDSDTADSIHYNKGLLSNISSERIYSELKKLLLGANASKVLADFSDVFTFLFPAFIKNTDVFFQNAKLLKNINNDDTVSALSVFFHGLNTEEVKSSLQCLKPDNYHYDNVRLLISYIDIDILTDEVSVRYIMSKLSDENIIRLSVLKKLFYPEFDYDVFIFQYRIQKSAGACIRIKDLAISGKDLISLGVSHGPAIGDNLQKALSAVIENKCANTKEDIIKYLEV